MDADISRTRIELKYLIPIEAAEAVTREIPAEKREEYRVSTLYFDSPNRALSARALRDPYDCIKVRVREYLGSPSELWVEVKSRNGAWTQKWRFAVPRDVVDSLLSEGGAIDLETLGAAATSGRGEAEGARAALREVAGGPLVALGAVRACRRTFALDSVPLRFTLDSRITYHLPSPAVPAGGAPSQGLGGALLYEEPTAVFELKHAGEIPLWCARIVSEMTMSGFSKFRSLVGHLEIAGRVAGHVDRL